MWLSERGLSFYRSDILICHKIVSRVERKVRNEENHLTAKREKKLKALGVQQSSNPLSKTAFESKKKRNKRFRRPKGKKNTEKQKDDKVVVNLSSVELSESETSLLSKGLGFCPRPKSYDRGELVEDNYAFSRRMRLKSHFSGFPDTRAPEKYPEFSRQVEHATVSYYQATQPKQQAWNLLYNTQRLP